MSSQFLLANCIIVQWTQINNEEYIPDSFGDLYFVSIDQITEGEV